MSTERSGWVRKLAATLMVAAIVAAFTLAVMEFSGGFRSTVPVTMYADRAGLVMNPDADVRLRGVQIGWVGSIESEGDRVKMTLDLQDNQLQKVPANVGAAIQSNTVFGAKNVELQIPQDPSSQSIAAGDTIAADRVQVELNTVFQQLVNVLSETQPEKLNATLGALSTALSGRGERVGQGLQDLSQFISRVNPVLDDVNRTVAGAATVTNVYADAFGDLTRILDNLTVTGGTIADKASSLDALLVNTTGLANTLNGIVGPKKQTIIAALTDLDPVAGLLGYQAPGLGCLLKTLSQAKDYALPVFGDKTGAIALNASVMPPKEPYRWPENLPENNVDAPPTCAYGLSNFRDNTLVPFFVGNNAQRPYQPRTKPKVDPTKIANIMFGPVPRG